jgi:hypothetical protein
MTEDKGKKGPRGVPIHLVEMETKVRQAAKEDKDGEQDISAVMIVSGGVHGEHYNFHFSASDKGVAECSLQCQMSDRQYETQEYKLPQGAFANVLETISVGDLAMASEQEVLIPPDSLIGQLELSDGENTIRTIFMADPGQAETAGYKMPPYLSQTTDAVYDLAAQVMVVEDVRP